MRSCRNAFLLLLLMALLAPLARPYDYIGLYNTAVSPNTMVPARYDVSKLPNGTITFYLTTQKPQALAPGDSVEALMTEIAAAAATWNSVSTSALRLNFGGYTKLSPDAAPTNPLGIIFFTPNLPPGVIAAGGSIFQVPSGGTPASLPISISRIELPADASHASSSSPIFLSAITHEMGHSIGTQHSHIGSTMYQTPETSRARVLTDDDVALISTLYPTSSFLAATGSISGRVTASGGGASLVAVSAYTDTVVIGAFTKPDGTFTIGGLPPGSYRLMVQPLTLGGAPNSATNNPNDPADLVASLTLTNAPVTINTNIDSAFFAGGGASTRDPSAAAAFPVTAGQITSGANISIGPRGPLRLEVNTASSFPATASQPSPFIWVNRGGQVVSQSDGKSLSPTGLSLGFTGPGVSLVSGSTQSTSTSNPIFNSSVRYTVQASAAATPGTSSVFYTNGTDMYFSPGMVRVVTLNPPQISGISPTTGATGATVTINGNNFTDTSQVTFDGMPVKITSRSATSLVVTAPPGVGGHPASVFVANSDGQGSEFLSTPPTFTYSSAPQPSASLSPSTATPGQALNMTVTGTNTNFQQGLTTVGFGSGDVVVDSVSVASPTTLVAHMHVLSAVSNSKFPVTVQTGEEVIFLDDSFVLGTQPPLQIQVISGAGQAGAPGSALAQPITVRAEDANGVPIAGVTVAFAVSLGGGSVSPATAVTDLQGLAQTRMTVGAATGFQLVVASADQFTSTIITEISGSSVPQLRLGTSGDGQTAFANSALPSPLTVTLQDSSGNPLANIPVGWQVASGGGSIHPLAASTDNTGNVSAVWTLGPLAGKQTAQAILFSSNGASQLGFAPISFSATAQTGSVAPTVPSGGILNGAGFDSSVAGLSPGAIASIFGSNLSTAPASGVLPGFAPGSTTMLNIVSNGTSVTFDGVAAPLFYVSPTQLNVQVPFETAGKTSVQMVVSLNGVNSTPVSVPMLPVTPGLFTISSSGKGAAAVLNQDGSLNSASNPAAAGSVIQLFATGLGAVLPAAVTGQLARTSPPLNLSVDNPTVTIGGVPAVLQFSGLAPGFVGLWQVNVSVPSGAGSGEVTLQLSSGGQNANPVTVFLP